MGGLAEVLSRDRAGVRLFRQEFDFYRQTSVGEKRNSPLSYSFFFGKWEVQIPVNVFQL